MRELCYVAAVMLICAAVVNAQRNPPPAPTPNENPIDSDRQKNISGRSDNLRLTEKFPVDTAVNSKVFRESIRPMYRDLTRDEKELLAPETDDSQRFEEFLNQKNTGLIRIIADKGCDKQFGVVVSSPHCEKYSMPGASSSYSFRTREYRMRGLGDILFSGKQFLSVGDLTQGIFLNLGDVPLESINLQTGSVSFLIGIPAAEDIEKADELTKNLVSENGITAGGFDFRGYALAAENTTYLLRSIAYRGNKYRTVQGMSYDEFEFDKRREITIAFRIVRLEDGESVTILWKELASGKSPKLKVPDDK